MRILMVCLGNICRSPLAEGIMFSKMKQAGIQNVIVDSAGTGAWHAGDPPDRRSVAVARKNGLDISQQCARQFKKEDFEKFDLIFAMDSSNFRDIKTLSPVEDHAKKVHLFLEFAGYEKNLDVPDPWYGDAKDFDSVYAQLDEACTRVVSRILEGKPEL